ncbi:hypothetical protein SODALDRAFT_330419 [Sodiomyces alkalinus F11]|uniref:Uncharacterized protein n=1 Tax=Sodiomyces alkalinus (strain CBS 110278 / VKM F-3762 / F11) TaxID=1314773 RepID=A0A3N2Q1P3_SODAK|nr:hypothetical protein SODALDRAFT_330419 [Sodiomyces alkalinus F11]ROT40677.1 hypothetical protein SODALDRAFT_330419 [Sodiomyces alkalinus F11]
MSGHEEDGCDHAKPYEFGIQDEQLCVLVPSMRRWSVRLFLFTVRIAYIQVLFAGLPN